jgi:hypothetical protein
VNFYAFGLMGLVKTGNTNPRVDGMCPKSGWTDMVQIHDFRIGVVCCMVPYDSQGHLGMPYSQGYDEAGGFTLDKFDFAPEIMANVNYTSFIQCS